MIKNIFRSLLCVAAVAAVSSCDKDDIYIGGADDSGIIAPTATWYILPTATDAAM